MSLKLMNVLNLLIIVGPKPKDRYERTNHPCPRRRAQRA
jgi:hypothetical protein